MSDTLQSDQTAAPQSTAADVTRTAQKATAAVAHELRESVAQGAAQAREEAVARTEDAKQTIAREVAAAAEALGTASKRLDERSIQRTLFDEASRGLASMSEALQGRSVGELVSDVAEFGRRNPAAFLGGAALAGFAVARLATASAPQDRAQGAGTQFTGGTSGSRSPTERPSHSGAKPEAAMHGESTRPFGQGGRE